MTGNLPRPIRPEDVQEGDRVRVSRTVELVAGRHPGHTNEHMADPDGDLYDRDSGRRVRTRDTTSTPFVFLVELLDRPVKAPQRGLWRWPRSKAERYFTGSEWVVIRPDPSGDFEEMGKIYRAGQFTAGTLDILDAVLVYAAPVVSG